MFDCYDNIFGLSNYDCECLRDNRPEDYNTSQSGLFLNELAGIESILSDGECDKSVWEMFESSRTIAVSKFVSDTNLLLQRKAKPRRRKAENQTIGQIKSLNTYSNSKNYGVIRIACAPIKSGFFDLKNIGSLFSENSSIAVSLYDNVNGHLQDVNIDTIQNRFKPNNVNISDLPMYSKYVDILEYYIVYQFDQNNIPKDNKIDCGCGSSSWPGFSLDFPSYVDIGKRRKTPWADYVMVGSTEINSLSELDDLQSSAYSNMLGLILELDFKCNVDEILCSNQLNFNSNPLAMSMAFAIMYKAGQLIADKIISSSMIDRPNMISRDEWENNSIMWGEKYNENVKNIVEFADISANDCLKCKDIIEMSRKGLFT